MNLLKYIIILGAIYVSSISIVESSITQSQVIYPPNYLHIWTADWCPKCPQMIAIGDKLKKEGFDVFIIDFDENREEARRNKIKGLPVAIVYTDGKEVERIIGISTRTAKKVEAQIRAVLEKNKEELNDHRIY